MGKYSSLEYFQDKWIQRALSRARAFLRDTSLNAPRKYHYRLTIARTTSGDRAPLMPRSVSSDHVWPGSVPKFQGQFSTPFVSLVCKPTWSQLCFADSCPVLRPDMKHRLWNVSLHRPSISDPFNVPLTSKPVPRCKQEKTFPTFSSRDTFVCK